MGKIHELPKSSSRLLTSSQIITSVYCVVKELIENSLDSIAKNIEVKLEDYGLEKVEVKDNGCGIDKSDIQFVARSHCTSKITSYSDLEQISSYGFRGEALGAICAVSDLVITTKTSEENIGCIVNYSHDGQVISTKPCPCSQGSTVSVLNLFKNIPVRRQYYRSEKNKKEDLRKVEELLIAYACIVYDVRFALFHNKNLIWQKPALSCTKNALIHVLGNSVVDHLKYSEYIDEQNQRKFEAYLPLPEAPLTCGLSSCSRCITSINNRPVRMKSLDKLIKEYYNKAIQNTGKIRYPICFISFTLPLKEVDVNIEPNKTNVTLNHSEEILNQFSEMLKTFYNTNVTENNQIILPAGNIRSNQEPKSTASDFLETLKANCDAKFQQTKLSYITENSIASKRNFLDKDVAIVSNGSTQKIENPIIKKNATNEPCKKKLKKTFHVSKEDFQSHLTSLKTFFSEDKIKDNNLSLSSVPTVTVERISSDQKNSSSDSGKLDSKGTTSFAISTNICSESNSHTIVNADLNQKRQCSTSEIKIIEHPTKQPNISNGEAWSRGIHPSGGLFQPIKILQPKASIMPESSSKAAQETINESKTNVPEQKRLSLERKLTAFDIFCRSNRLEVAAQNPEFSNQQIAQVLSEKWSHLSSEEKAMYKNMLDKDYKQNVRKKERLRKIVSQSLSQTQDEMPKEIHKKMKPKLKDKVISFDAEIIKEYYNKKNSSKDVPTFNELNLIHSLAPGIWICSRNEKLYLLNTFRLHETVIYHRLLETFQFESEHLQKSIYISAKEIGDDGMKVLMKLCKTEIYGSETIEDPRLTANGFDVKVTKGMGSDITVELVGITSNIAFYGIPDLKELLLLIQKKGCSASLSECRPGKIMLYLQGEANRMSRQSPACQRIQDVESLLNQSNFGCRYNECIHHKPFFNELWSLQ